MVNDDELFDMVPMVLVFIMFLIVLSTCQGVSCAISITDNDVGTNKELVDNESR